MRTIFLTFLFIPWLQFGQQRSLADLSETKIDHFAQNPVHDILLYVEQQNPTRVYSKHFGGDSTSLETAPEDIQFRIASSTKLFVATIIMQLVEEGKIQLADMVMDYLRPIPFLETERLHIFNGKQYASDITIDQLLSHRTGLADLYTDAQAEFFSLLEQHPQKEYSPEAIIAHYYELGLHIKPHFPPGQGWYYSDMNYVLLGLLIETLDQVPLAASIRNRILRPLSMEDTYFEYYEKPLQRKGRINQYVGNLNFSEINTSFDWAGGGLVSTHGDLARFARALFGQQLVSGKSLHAMMDVTFTKASENRYGLGMFESHYNGKTYFGHYGYYGTYIGYCPENDNILSYCISQASPDFEVYSYIDEVMKRLE